LAERSLLDKLETGSRAQKGWSQEMVWDTRKKLGKMARKPFRETIGGGGTPPDRETGSGLTKQPRESTGAAKKQSYKSKQRRQAGEPGWMG